MSKRILVVDDQEPLLSLLRMLLEDEGYKVSIMREGRGAFASVQEDPPDLVILDLRLADASGADILESLRAHEATAEIPVIIYTAAVLEAETMTNLISGNPTRYRNVAVLQKPFEQDALLERVRQMLTAPQPLQS